MPLTRSNTAPRSCLRCQLRQVIFRSRYSATRPCFLGHANSHVRGLNISARRSQGSEGQEDGAFLKENSRDDKRRVIYRREYPLGRIVGQPGRRQRESSETLKIDSMRRPFDVVLMQDVQEAKDEKDSTGNAVSQELKNRSAVSPTQLASGLLNQLETPDQDEVDESIDALHPTVSIVDRQQYDSLLKQLSHGYNIQQLSSYLFRRPFLREDDNHAISRDSLHTKGDTRSSSWRPGRTPIEKRHRAVTLSKANKFASTKKRLTEQILRFAWNLTIHSEEQEIGEVEIPLHTWQIHYLFDLHLDNKPKYEDVIQPQLLLRSSEVLLYRPDNVVRITTRRRDAEEIAGLIRTELREVGKLELDLSVFKPLLGKPGWPKNLAKILPSSDLNYVGQYTTNVIERKDEKTMCIYNKSETTRQHGKRLLLSLLDLPSPGSNTVLDGKAADNSNGEVISGGEHILLPESTGSSLHFRYRSTPLSRLAIPTYRTDTDSRSTVNRKLQSEVQLDHNRSALAVHVAEKLAMEVPKSLELSTSAFSSGSSSYWEATPKLDDLPWEVQFCRILQACSTTQDASGTRKSTSPRQNSLNHKTLSTIQPEVPGIATLLSHFSPRNEGVYAFDNSPNTPHLIAHFFPSPFTTGGVDAMRNLPRIELCYDFSTRQDIARPADSQALRLSHMRAILHLQELRIPLPNEAVDIRVLRRLPLIGKLDRIFEDEEIMQFTEALQQSVSSGSGALEGQAAIKMKLPRWIVNGEALQIMQGAPREDVEVEYFFERFEQVQKAEFAPIRPLGFTDPVDPAMKQVLDGMPESSFLEYKMVEGGVIGGSRGELSLKVDKVESNRSDNQTSGETKQKKDSQLVDTALQLATSLTRINAGKLQALRTTLQYD